LVSERGLFTINGGACLKILLDTFAARCFASRACAGGTHFLELSMPRFFLLPVGKMTFPAACKRPPLLVQLVHENYLFWAFLPGWQTAPFIVCQVVCGCILVPPPSPPPSDPLYNCNSNPLSRIRFTPASPKSCCFPTAFGLLTNSHPSAS